MPKTFDMTRSFDEVLRDLNALTDDERLLVIKAFGQDTAENAARSHQLAEAAVEAVIQNYARNPQEIVSLLAAFHAISSDGIYCALGNSAYKFTKVMEAVAKLTIERFTEWETPKT